MPSSGYAGPGYGDLTSCLHPPLVTAGAASSVELVGNQLVNMLLERREIPAPVTVDCNVAELCSSGAAAHAQLLQLGHGSETI